MEEVKRQKHTTVGIRWSSPIQLLIHRSGAYVWQSGRDAQFSPVYGRMCWKKCLQRDMMSSCDEPAGLGYSWVESQHHSLTFGQADGCGDCRNNVSEEVQPHFR
jgi:hypothetical protein